VSARWLRTPLLLAIAWVAGLPGIAWAGEIVLDNKAYEETARMVLQNGEIVVHLRPKVTKGEASAASPAAETDAPAATPAAVPKKYAVVPTLNKEAADAIAADMKSQASPGLTALGVTPSAMSTPGTPKEFGAALARGIDASGNVKEGVAVQFSPASLFAPYSLKGGSRFNGSRGMQAWARTSVELATAKSEDKRIGQQLAASVSTGLIDDGDPRLYWELLSDCTKNILQSIPRPGEVVDPDIAKAEFAAASKCYQDKWSNVSKTLWAAPRWYAGAAKSWYTGDSTKLSHAQRGPSMLWTTYSQGFDWLNPRGSRFKTLAEFAATRKRDLQVDDPADATLPLNESRTDLSARLRFSREQWSGFADFGLARVRTGGVLSENVRHFGYGVEYKVSDTLWLVLASVSERGFVSGDKRTLISTGLRFGQSDKDLVGGPPQGK
jgi:hypothetical protein